MSSIFRVYALGSLLALFFSINVKADSFEWETAKVKKEDVGRFSVGKLSAKIGEIPIDHGRKELAVELIWESKGRQKGQPIFQEVVDETPKLSLKGDTLQMSLRYWMTGAEEPTLKKRCWKFHSKKEEFVPTTCSR